MKKKILILILLIGGYNFLYAQLNQWTKQPINCCGAHCFTSDRNGNIYAAGDITNISGKFIVLKQNGVNWVELGTGLNAPNPITAMCTDTFGNVFATCLSDSLNDLLVYKWNGTFWNRLGNGISKLVTGSYNYIYSLSTDRLGNIYAAGNFFDSLGYYYVAKWNGTAWTELGEDTNALAANNYIYSIVTDTENNIYAAGNFTNNNGFYYVAKWNGSKWAELGTGANALNANLPIITILEDGSGKIYARGIFRNVRDKFYVAKWDGFIWSQFGSDLSTLLYGNGFVPLWKYLLTLDNQNNVINSIKDPTTKGFSILKWNGVSWIEQYKRADSICILTALYSDINGNIYAAVDSFYNYFILKWSNPTPSKNARAFTIINKDSSSFKVSFTKGNGMKRLVICGTAPLASLPVDSFSYGANSVLKTGYQFGADNWIVYNDTGTSVSIKGLDVCTKYYVSVIEYNYDSTHTWYLRYQYLQSTDSTTFHHVLKINTATGDTSFCNTPSIKITGNNYTDATYQWYKNSVVINGATNYVDTTVTVSGIYSLRISKNSCTLNSNNLNILLNSKPNAGYTINNVSQCLNGNNFAFKDTTSGVHTKLWNLGDLTTNTNDTFGKSYSAAGNYNVKLKVTDANNCTDSVTKIITVKPNPIKPTVSVITKSQLQSTSAASYQWYLNTTVINGATQQTLIITKNGNYTVKADSTNGCSNLSDPFTAGSVGIEQVYSSNEINIYPNPNTGTFTINFNNTEGEKQLAIYNLQGKLVAHYTTTESVYEVSEILSHGMYFIKAETTTGSFITKFVVE
ncbi:MAG: T9SS type A sorting domain-containing protein [Bacteroidota bacterium]